jgi:hypothetical protein
MVGFFCSLHFLWEEDLMTRLFALTMCVVTLAISAAPVGAQFFDDFDSYTAGTNVAGNNGWQGWDNDNAAGAIVDNSFSNSAPNSIVIEGPSDLVNRMGNPTSGIWRLTADQYIPSGFSPGQQGTFFIVQNIYNDGGPYNWSVELRFDGNGNIIDNYGSPTGQTVGNYVVDQWAEIRIDIDLDNDTVNQYYNGALLGAADQAWAFRPGSGSAGTSAIGALDLFANGSSRVFYDNVSLVQIPEPSAALLGLCALLAAVWLGRR